MNKVTFRESQKEALAILKTVALFCDNNNLKYSLTYGTLLGAIRHNGFIPWDDDIDIMMPRKDFLVFLSTFKDSKLKVFHKDNTANYPYLFAKVSNIVDTVKQESFLKEKTPERGIEIDIFPYDLLPNNCIHRFFFKLRNINLFWITDNARYKGFMMGTFFNRLITSPYRYVSKKHSIEYWIEKSDSLLKKYMDKTDSKYGWFDVKFKLLLSKSLFDNLEKHSFEDDSFFVPADYDTVLKMLYGDYMKLPPEADRVPPHESSIIYWLNKGE